MTPELLIPFVVGVGTSLAFWLGRWYERRLWRGSLRVISHDTKAHTIILADASSLGQGDAVTFDTAPIRKTPEAP